MTRRLTLSAPVKGQPLRIGSGFEASHFGEHFFNGRIDPVVMVDHFQMTAPTFEPHPHAGISAVTYLFEDSTAPHVNYDSLGNQGPIEPGALHWLAAGRGAVHTEQPEGASPYVHALQIFVNLPANQKMASPFAVHAAAATIPEFHGEGVRVRVVAGHSNDNGATRGGAAPTLYPARWPLRARQPLHPSAGGRLECDDLSPDRVADPAGGGRAAPHPGRSRDGGKPACRWRRGNGTAA